MLPQSISLEVSDRPIDQLRDMIDPNDLPKLSLGFGRDKVVEYSAKIAGPTAYVQHLGTGSEVRQKILGRMRVPEQALDVSMKPCAIMKASLHVRCRNCSTMSYSSVTNYISI